MNRVERPWLWLLPAGAAAGALALVLVLRSDHADNRVSFGALGLVLDGRSSAAGSTPGHGGRTTARTGALMVAAGFMWFLGPLT